MNILYPLNPSTINRSKLLFSIQYIIFDISYDANVQPGTSPNLRDELLNRLCQPPDSQVADKFADFLHSFKVKQ